MTETIWILGSLLVSSLAGTGACFLKWMAVLKEKERLQETIVQMKKEHSDSMANHETKEAKLLEDNLRYQAEEFTRPFEIRVPDDYPMSP
jgi:hypothetical protein